MSDDTFRRLDEVIAGMMSGYRLALRIPGEPSTVEFYDVIAWLRPEYPVCADGAQDRGNLKAVVAPVPARTRKYA